MTSSTRPRRAASRSATAGCAARGSADNAIAVATTVAVAERVLARPGGSLPVAVVFTVGEEGLGGLRGARHACHELVPEAVLALEGHG